MYQHTDKQIMEEKKRIQALSKRDFPEFPANKDLTSEEYIEYRQYFSNDCSSAGCGRCS